MIIAENNNRIVLKKVIPETNVRAVVGYGGRVAVKQAFRAIGDRSYAVLPTVNLPTGGSNFPGVTFRCHTAISPYAGAAVMMSGVSAGLRALGIKHLNIIGFPGEAGVIENDDRLLFESIDRNERMVYLCYDNEAYLNSGVRRGSIRKKSLFDIVTTHRIPYAATASVSHYADFIRKVEAAWRVDGVSFIHVLAPSPNGWGLEAKESLRVARATVESGLWPLLESREGEIKINYEPLEFASVSNCLFAQGKSGEIDSDSLLAAVNERDYIWESLRRKIRGTIYEDYCI